MRLEFRPMLVSGMTGCDDHGAVTMLIDSEQCEAAQARALYHEMIHALLIAGDAPKEAHDEEKIEALAVRLAAAVPEIIRFIKERAPCLPKSN